MADELEAESKVNVLVVDDSRENRLALQAVLASQGYRLVEASSGAEALRRLLDEEFAVLLLDVVMPGMSGFELASAIRQRERAAAVPIVFLTGEARDLDQIYKGYRVGAVDYLLKPLVPEMVRAKVAVFAESHRQRKRIERQAALLLDTERRESEVRLAELRLASERHYRNLAEAVPHIVWTARPDGHVDYFNRRWFEYTGISLEAATGSWQGAIHPDALDVLRHGWQVAARSGRMFEAECRVRRGSDGAFRWHLCRAVPELGVDGQVVSWLGTFTDIDDQKQAQAALSEFKTTLDAVLDAVTIFDVQTLRMVYVNQGASALLGYRPAELLRMRASELLGVEDGALRETLAPLQDGSKPATALERHLLRNDGREVPVDISFQLVPTDGGEHVVSIARDITSRKLAELERAHLYDEALAAIRARDEFLSIASHELKTPLASMKLQLDLLLKPERRADISREDLFQRLGVATRQADRMSRLIAELMDVSRITAGRLHLETEDVDLAALAGDVVDRFKEDAARAGCEIVLRAAGRVQGRWDRLRLEQVVTNLLSNALKFGAGHAVEVTVTEGEHARLVVRDHGMGIAREDLERVFDRYERATAARGIAGLGLGLYIVRQILVAHGGSIRVESEPGAGSAFTVELPARTTRDDELPAERVAAAGAEVHADAEERVSQRGADG